MTLQLCAGTLESYRARTLGSAGAEDGESPDSSAATRDWRARVDAALAAHGIAVEAMPADAATVSAELGWSAYGALVLWAAYCEQPQLARPALEPLEWHKDIALARCLADGFRSAFPTLVHGVELWVPGNDGVLFDLPGPAGDDVPSGTVGALTAELDALNASTWRASRTDSLAWREDVDPESALLADLARRGFAIVRGLADHAAESRLALWLDY